MKFSFAFPAALAALLVGASFASAGDSPECPKAPAVGAKEHFLVFGDGATRFRVERDATAGRMTFRLADPVRTIDGAPVVVMTTDAGPKEVVLTAVDGQPGVWTWSNDAVKAEKFDGTMRVVVAGKTYTSPLATVWTSEEPTDALPMAPPAPDARFAPDAKDRVLVFGDGAARFNVERDPAMGRMTFRLADPALKVDSAPVVLMTKDAGGKEIVLLPVDGQPGVWTWSNDAVKAETFDGTMRVVVAGKTYTSPLATVWTSRAPAEAFSREPAALKARFGGRVLMLPACGTSVEVVQDLQTGTLTIYSAEDVVVTEAPVITVTESKGPSVVTLTKVDGKPGVWTAKNDGFKTTTMSAKIRLLVNGKPCEAPIVFGSSRGGQMVPVVGGPSFEVVRDPKEGTYTFYALDETYDGKAYTVENPNVFVDGHTYQLTRVEGEPRAWRLVGLDAAGSDARNGQLNFTLLGKTLSTRVGLSGVGVNVK